MTESKLINSWETFKKNYRINTSQALEEYILEGNGNPDELKISRCIRVWDYPSDIVKEMKSGINAELAKRILYVISKIDDTFGIINYSFESKLNLYYNLGYSFNYLMENLKEANSYYLMENSEKLFNVYGDEAISYITEEMLNQNTQNPFPKLNIMIFILVKAVLTDYEKYNHLLPYIYKYSKYLTQGNYLTIVCRLYNLNSDTYEVFKQCLKKGCYISAMWKDFNIYHGKDSLKKELYKLNMQKEYYSVIMKDGISDISSKRQVYLEQMYAENRDLYAEVCGELLADKYQCNNAVFALAVMLYNNDGEKELQKVVENSVHYVYNFCKDLIIYGKDDENISKIVKTIISDEYCSDDMIKIKFKRWSFCGGSEKMFSILSIFYGFSGIIRNAVKNTFKSAYEQSEERVVAEFYTNFVETRKKWLHINERKSTEIIVNEILPVEVLFKIYCYKNSKGWTYNTKIDKNIVAEFAEKNPQTALEYFDKISGVQENVAWLDFYYNLNVEKNFSPLIEALKNKSSKNIRKKAFEIAENYENEIRGELEDILPKLKGEACNNVEQLIKKWDNIRKFGKDFAFTSNEFIEEFCQSNISPAMLRKISWIDEMCFEGIKYSDLSKTASPNVLKYIICEYMALDEPYRITSCDKIVEKLNSTDLQNSLENIFKLWVENGADTKKKFISLPYCIYASDSQLLKIKKQLETWAKASRGALASFVVKNIALNGGSIALLTVDNISKKFPNNMVKNAAKSAISFAAESLGISVDELTDKIIPNLGFDKNGERIFDYGSRTFTISLMPDFSLSIYDNSKEKNIKSMPKPNDKDDLVKAEAAKKEFSELKKQIKTVITSQKQRLERVFMNGRTWSVEKWRTLFEDNAVMHCFAEKLIWGIYEDKKLKSTFRYLSDGSFCNEEDDEFELPENAEITLVHPVEMSSELIEKWSEQLEDYEIVQPFNQLSAKIIKLDDNDINEDFNVNKYFDKSVTVSKVSSAAKKYDMTRGEVGDGGGFDGYELTDTYLGVSMMIYFDMLYFGQDYNETVTIQNIEFYMYDDNKKAVVNPKTLNSRFISSCFEIIENMLDM